MDAQPKKPAPTTASSVRDRIRQTREFRSARQEGVIALLLAHDALRHRLVELLASAGEVTMQQYNVLRILRGAGPDGLPTLEIAERMIERSPGVTRLLDRLEKRGLVRRERSAQDRRQVFCRISAEGRELLARLDEPMNDLDEQSLGALSDEQVQLLIELLNKIRLSL